jgi:hypothetical protein
MKPLIADKIPHGVPIATEENPAIFSETDVQTVGGEAAGGNGSARE